MTGHLDRGDDAPPPRAAVNRIVLDLPAEPEPERMTPLRSPADT